ncbi:uncharacterized mitochondrial protein AtMg00810-like [Aristolochia californica]|uniref:uncharacterized mitochondrial protein AtMg00810-like n=1 Tax=Aristolochia californica TaxID=171875 RepID=UPI0035DBC313
MVLLLVYVDDIIITGTDSGRISKVQQVLHATFNMKDLGHLTYFLRLEVHHHPNGLFLNQHKYTQDLISLAGLEDTSSVATPMEVNVKYRKDERILLDDHTIYRQLVESLIYLTTTRLDISYVVYQVSQFMSSPRHLHLMAVRRIIRYLRSSPTRGLFFPTSSALRLVAYSDAYWVGCLDTRRSTTGWCIFLGDALISWKCRKQDRFPLTSATQLHADNMSVIQIVANPVFHERTKHIEVDCHSICDTLERRVISLPCISLDLQVADIFTKALSHPRHNFLVGKLLLLNGLGGIVVGPWADINKSVRLTVRAVPSVPGGLGGSVHHQRGLVVSEREELQALRRGVSSPRRPTTDLSALFLEEYLY